MFHKIKNPILFQGDLNKKNYFEGWYYKQVSADKKISLSFIPGVSLHPNDHHSFIQYILTKTNDQGKKETITGYIRYGIDEFFVRNDPFRVQIGQSIFTKDSLTIDLKDTEFSFKGQLQFGTFYPIKESVSSPNIMGPFAYIPGMQCYHGVISMLHELKGALSINAQWIDFSNGRGYIEKDWGNAFPKHYIWLHSNHFKETDTSLFFSIAHIPFYITEFEGFICNLVYQGKEYRFASYNRSSCEVQTISQKTAKIKLESKEAILQLEAEVSDSGQLIAPVTGGQMDKTIKEGMSGIIYLQLKNKITGELYTDTGYNAGVEIVDYH